MIGVTDRAVRVEQIEREILWADKGVRLGATLVDRERSQQYKSGLEMELAAAKSDLYAALKLRNKIAQTVLVGVMLGASAITIFMLLTVQR